MRESGLPCLPRFGAGARFAFRVLGEVRFDLGMSTRLGPLRTVVRAARAADRGFIVGLSEEAFVAYARNAGANALRMMRADAAILVAEEVQTMRRLGFAIVRVTPLGRAFGPWANPGTAYLDAIAVRDDMHGRGVGRALLASVEDVARDRGAVSISLLTADSNVRARALFVRAGYAPLLPVLSAYIDEQSACTFTKSLVTGRGRAI